MDERSHDGSIGIIAQERSARSPRSSCLPASPAAAGVEDFYKGRNVSLIIGYSVGGGYDAYARLLARYIGKHIPGRSLDHSAATWPAPAACAPPIIIYSVAAKDGSVFGTFSRSMGIAPLIDKADFDSRKFTWLGSVTDDNTICVTWNTSPIKTWNDFLSKPSKFGGEGAGADPDIWALLYKNVFGAKVQLVTGYPGTNDVDAGDGARRGRRPVRPVVEHHQDPPSANGSTTIRSTSSCRRRSRKSREMATVPLATDLATNPEQLQIVKLLLTSQAMARPFAAPPDIPGRPQGGA